MQTYWQENYFAQAASREVGSYVDQIFTPLHLAQAFAISRKYLYAFFLYAKKAYDTVQVYGQRGWRLGHCASLWSKGLTPMKLCKFMAKWLICKLWRTFYDLRQKYVDNLAV